MSVLSYSLIDQNQGLSAVMCEFIETSKKQAGTHFYYFYFKINCYFFFLQFHACEVHVSYEYVKGEFPLKPAKRDPLKRCRKRAPLPPPFKI